MIDVVDEEPDLLRLMAERLGPIVVPQPVLMEVPTITVADATRFGLTIHIPTIEQSAESAPLRSRLSATDMLCLIVARDLGLTCVTSDRQLVARCKTDRVEVIPALEPLLLLVRGGAIEAERCRAMVRRMRARNGYLTTQVVAQFETRLRTAARRARSDPRS